MVLVGFALDDLAFLLIGSLKNMFYWNIFIFIIYDCNWWHTWRDTFRAIPFTASFPPRPTTIIICAVIDSWCPIFINSSWAAWWKVSMFPAHRFRQLGTIYTIHRCEKCVTVSTLMNSEYMPGCGMHVWFISLQIQQSLNHGYSPSEPSQSFLDGVLSTQTAPGQPDAYQPGCTWLWGESGNIKHLSPRIQ